jgi:hypothetical protein
MSIRSIINVIREIKPELKFIPAEIKSSASFITEIKPNLKFTPAKIKSNASFITEIRRQLQFPFDESYNFSYVLEEGGFFCLQENGDKIILQ